jgi:glycosyltransferase involved in cell wall biosynthesis
VTFAGPRPHEIVQQEMRHARCFVQHSIVAQSGDAEGMPLAIIEASATGLPVVSTRHAGIPDVVADQETGFLVDEGDVAGMSHYMVRMIRAPELAAQMGKAARERALAYFSKERSLTGLWNIIEGCINHSTAKTS